jgi:hypothetical protein
MCDNPFLANSLLSFLSTQSTYGCAFSLMRLMEKHSMEELFSFSRCSLSDYIHRVPK